MIKEVASKTSDLAGDGTTTATVLAQSIFRSGLRNVTAGANPMALHRGIEQAVAKVVAELGKLSKSTKDKKEIAQVATIASNNDKTIGSLIAEAMEKVGKDGVITVEEAKTMDTTLEVVEGMQFDRGYLSPYMVTDPERMEAVLEGSVVLEKVKAAKETALGFDAESNEYVDMVRAGIIDPTKVERVALPHAASIASLLLTTTVVITDGSEDGKAAMTAAASVWVRRPPRRLECA